MIGILHAYSRANVGDGLLVDLTLERLARHGIEVDDVVLLALAPDTFPEIPRRHAIGTPGRALDLSALRALGRGLRLVAGGPRRGPLAGCRALVAVGGGYLRTPDTRAAVGTALNHLPQLSLAARFDGPTAYLPQSIGPLRGPVGARVRGQLDAIDTVFVRDDESLSELAGIHGVTRMPDLAVLELAERAPEPAVPGDAVVLVGRALDDLPDAGARLADIARVVPAPHLYAVQAAGDPRKSDEAFYGRSGIQAAGRLPDVLGEGRAGVVISVRLHGALMAILAGVPAIHLAYDRKGPAAFADLDLAAYCLDVDRAEPTQVAALAAGLLEDPSRYWGALAARRPELVARSEALDASLGRLLGR